MNFIINENLNYNYVLTYTCKEWYPINLLSLGGVKEHRCLRMWWHHKITVEEVILTFVLFDFR